MRGWWTRAGSDIVRGRTMETRAPLLLAEETLFCGRYRVQRQLRAGGMGAVYEVLDESTRRRRALKVMLPALVGDAEMRARFAREATITSELRSEHLVDVLDAGVDDATGAPFLVMELLEGEELAEVLVRRGALSAAETVDLLRQAARVVDQAHEAGIVHRDLKPSNLFLARLAGGGSRLKVLDFGIAKLIAASMTSAAPTRSLGTPLYMAPEQARGDGTIDGRADLYSIAQIAFTLLTGKPYFEPESRSGDGVFPVLLAVTTGVDEPATARAGSAALPPGFDAWFVRAAALDPGARFDTAAEMIESLAETLGEPGISTRSALSSPLEPPSRGVTGVTGAPGSRGRLRIGVFALATLAAAAGISWMVTARRGAPPAGAQPLTAESTTMRVQDDPRANASAPASVHQSLSPTVAITNPTTTMSAVPSAPSSAAPRASGGAAAAGGRSPDAARAAAAGGRSPDAAHASGAKPSVPRTSERPPEETW